MAHEQGHFNLSKNKQYVQFHQNFLRELEKIIGASLPTTDVNITADFYEVFSQFYTVFLSTLQTNQPDRDNKQLLIFKALETYLTSLVLYFYNILGNDNTHLVYSNIHTAFTIINQTTWLTELTKADIDIVKKVNGFLNITFDLYKLNEFFFHFTPEETPCTSLIQQHYETLWGANPHFILALIIKSLTLKLIEDKTKTDANQKSFSALYETLTHQLSFTLTSPDKMKDSQALRLAANIVFVNPDYLKTLSVETLNKLKQHLATLKTHFSIPIIIYLEFYINMLSYVTTRPTISANDKTVFEVLAGHSLDEIIQLDNTPEIEIIFKSSFHKNNFAHLACQFSLNQGITLFDLSILPSKIILEIFKSLVDSAHNKPSEIVNNIVLTLLNYYQTNHFILDIEADSTRFILEWLSESIQLNLIDKTNPALTQFLDLLNRQLSCCIFYILSYDNLQELYQELTVLEKKLSALSDLYETDTTFNNSLKNTLGAAFYFKLKQEIAFLDKHLLLFISSEISNTDRTNPEVIERHWLQLLEHSLEDISRYINTHTVVQYLLLQRVFDFYIRHKTPENALSACLMSSLFFLLSSPENRKLLLKNELLSKIKELKSYKLSGTTLAAQNSKINAFCAQLKEKNLIDPSTLIDTHKPIDSLESIIKLINTPTVVKPNAEVLAEQSKQADLKSKLNENQKSLNSQFDRAMQLLKKCSIVIPKKSNDMNNLISQLASAAKSANTKLSKDANNKQLIQAITELQALTGTCLIQLSLENKPVQASTKEEIIFIKSLLHQQTVNSQSTLSDIISKLKLIQTKLEKASFRHPNDAINFYKILEELLNLFQDQSLLSSLDTILQDKDIHKILATIRGKITHHLSGKFETKKAFETFLSSLPEKQHFRSTLLFFINNSLAVPEDLIKIILGENIFQILKARKKSLSALDKFELFLAFDETGSKNVKKAHELAKGFFEIKFSEFQYNADIICYFYQKLKYYPKLRAQFYKVLSDYVTKIQLNPLQEDDAIILLLYIVTSHPSHYFTLSKDTQASLWEISKNLAQAENYVLYDYFLIYTSALDLITRFDQFDQEKKFLAAQTILNWLHALQNAEYNHPDSSPFNLLVEDSLEFINQQLALKLNINSELPELISENTDSTLNAGQLILQLENLLSSVNPFQKTFQDINPAMAHAGSFAVKKDLVTAQSSTEKEKENESVLETINTAMKS